MCVLQTKPRTACGRRKTINNLFLQQVKCNNEANEYVQMQGTYISRTGVSSVWCIVCGSVFVGTCFRHTCIPSQ